MVSADVRLVLAALVLVSAPAAADTLIVGNKGEASVSLIDLETGRERARIETGEQPHEVAVSPDGRQAAVVSYAGTTVDIIDIARAEKVDTIDLAPNAAPHGIVWTRDNRLIVTTEDSGTLTIVDMASRAMHAIPTGQEGSHMVAVSPDLARAYVANVGSGTVTVIDLAERRKITDLAVGEAAEGIALTPDGRELWVADRDGAKVVVFDTASLERVAEIAVGQTPIRVAISPDGRTAVTSNYAEGTLTLIDVASHQVRRTQTVLGNAETQQVTIVFSPDGARLYVAQTAPGFIVEIDLAEGELLGLLGAGAGSDGLAISPVDVERRLRP
ncbi:MAG: YncE family protein [Sphingomonadaceae bacterium]|nr:YncE family protein [Sphingomonadaceae bacterium]